MFHGEVIGIFMAQRTGSDLQELERVEKKRCKAAASPGKRDKAWQRAGVGQSLATVATRH